MSNTPCSFDCLTELARLIEPGLLGFYTHFEAIEVVAFPPNCKSAINVFSIFVTEEMPNEVPQAPEFLNAAVGRIKLPSLKEWSFGVMRYTQPIASLIPALRDLEATGEWRGSGHPLTVGKVTPLPPQFVSPDAIEPVPLNRVLKNNFWNGAQVFEWSDSEKSILQPLFERPQRLQELSEEVRKWVPLSLGSLSDRLGNIIVQLPVTVLMSQFAARNHSNDFVVDLAWHPLAIPRELRGTCYLMFDGAICGYMSLPIKAPSTRLPLQAGRGTHCGVIWDEQHQVILAATGSNAIVSTFTFALQLQQPEPRVFEIKDRDGISKPQRVALTDSSVQGLVGNVHNDANGGWTQKRVYTDEISQLTEERRFVQYRPRPGLNEVNHEKALHDLRTLINRYGENGAWLWDPYLSAHDILETLFYCQHAGADLKALTSAKEAPTEDMQRPRPGTRVRSKGTARRSKRTREFHMSQTKKIGYIERQRLELEGCQSNWQGLRLEYRVKRGPEGWGFHDRFLIFPKVERGALAWSLGTSVNSVGKEHHILQQVDNGQMVMDAFLELWNELNKPEHIVWKKL